MQGERKTAISFFNALRRKRARFDPSTPSRKKKTQTIKGFCGKIKGRGGSRPVASGFVQNGTSSVKKGGEGLEKLSCSNKGGGKIRISKLLISHKLLGRSPEK